MSRELVAYLEHRGRIPELVDICQRRRPNASWECNTGMNETAPLSFSRLFVIGALNFTAGVLGNLVAALIQKDWLNNVFTLPRVAAILVLTVIVLTVEVLLQRKMSLSRSGGTIVAAMLVVLVLSTLITTNLPANPATSEHTFDYAVQVEERDTSEGIPNASVTIDIPGGKAPSKRFTDANGFATFSIDASYASQSAVLTVNAPGYREHMAYINLIKGELPYTVQLESTP